MRCGHRLLVYSSRVKTQTDGQTVPLFEGLHGTRSALAKLLQLRREHYELSFSNHVSAFIN